MGGWAQVSHQKNSGKSSQNSPIVPTGTDVWGLIPSVFCLYILCVIESYYSL